MRDILTDIVKQTKDLFGVVKVTGTDTETRLQAVDDDKMFVLNATLAVPVAEFMGEFGISNLGMLDGLLNFPSYRTDEAQLEVVRKTRGKGETVEYFRFVDANGEGAVFRCMSPDLIDTQASVPKIPWDVTLAPQKSKIAEFHKLAGLFNDVDKFFSLHTKKTKGQVDLVFSIGSEDSSSHRSAMVFESGVGGEIKQPLPFNTQQFLSLTKVMGATAMDCSMSLYHKGVLSVTVTTPLATYNYYMRARKEV